MNNRALLLMILVITATAGLIYCINYDKHDSAPTGELVLAAGGR